MTPLLGLPHTPEQTLHRAEVPAPSGVGTPNSILTARHILVYCSCLLSEPCPFGYPQLGSGAWHAVLIRPLLPGREMHMIRSPGNSWAIISSPAQITF